MPVTYYLRLVSSVAGVCQQLRMLLTRRPGTILAVLAVAGALVCRAQNDIEPDPLTGTRYRIDGDGGSLVDVRSSLEP